MPGKRHGKTLPLAGVPDSGLLLAAAMACPHGLAIERDSIIAFANATYAALLGHSTLDDILGKSAAAVRRGSRSVRARRKHRGVELDSIKLDFSHHGQELRLEVLRDVTERRRLEEEVRVAHKMEALGRAVGGVAHDFNNLLTSIMLYCDLLAQQIPPDGAARRHADEISLAAQRGAIMVRQMLAFARQQVLRPQLLSLNMMVLGMKHMLQRLLGEDIELVTRCPESLGQVKVDPAQIQQVIFNLVTNARDAMAAGGQLVLETAEIDLDHVRAQRYPGLRARHCVRLTVADNGCGMSPGTLSHIFEPFFTTKEKGKGTGLGLPMVYGIVTQSGGAITVESRRGKGTRVDILLPRAEKAGSGIKATPVASRLQKSPASGCETVLVVEADAAVREPAAQILHQAGYTILKSRDAGEARNLAGTHTGPIHLLLTDFAAPRLSGLDLVHSVRQHRPDIRVLYMCASRDEVRKFKLVSAETGIAMLLKPFTQRTLTRKVRQVLDRPRALAAKGHA